MDTLDAPDTRRSNGWVGRVSLVCGLLGLAAVVWAWILSGTPLNPPNWVRIVGLVFLPIGIGGAIGAGLAGRHGDGRRLALAGLALAALTVVGFVVLVNAYG